MPAELEDARQLLSGQRIKRLLVTPMREMDPGLSNLAPAYFFSVVMELQGGEMTEIQSAWIGPWKGDEPLTEVTNQFHIEPETVYHGRRISDVCMDEKSQWFIRLDNDVVIRVVSEWGDDLQIGSPDENRKK